MIRLADGTSWSDPEDPALVAAMYTARYDLESLTQAEAYRLLDAVAGYRHLTTHESGTQRQIEKLRDLRRAVRAARKAGK